MSDGQSSSFVESALQILQATARAGGLAIGLRYVDDLVVYLQAIPNLPESVEREAEMAREELRGLVGRVNRITSLLGEEVARL